MINRYYDPTTDQFLSVDPGLAETGQPYAFTADNPLNQTDPMGLAPYNYSFGLGLNNISPAKLASITQKIAHDCSVYLVAKTISERAKD